MIKDLEPTPISDNFTPKTRLYNFCVVKAIKRPIQPL